MVLAEGDVVHQEDAVLRLEAGVDRLVAAALVHAVAAVEEAGSALLAEEVHLEVVVADTRKLCQLRAKAKITHSRWRSKAQHGLDSGCFGGMRCVKRCCMDVQLTDVSVWQMENSQATIWYTPCIWSGLTVQATFFQVS